MRVPPDLFFGFWGSPGGKNYHVTMGHNATFYMDEADTGHKTKRLHRRRHRSRAGGAVHLLAALGLR